MNESEYITALARCSELMDAEPGSFEETELELLSGQVEEYERWALEPDVHGLLDALATIATLPGIYAALAERVDALEKLLNLVIAQYPIYGVAWPEAEAIADGDRVRGVGARLARGAELSVGFVPPP